MGVHVTPTSRPPQKGPRRGPVRGSQGRRTETASVNVSETASAAVDGSETGPEAMYTPHRRTGPPTTLADPEDHLSRRMGPHMGFREPVLDRLRPKVLKRASGRPWRRPLESRRVSRKPRDES